MSDFQDHLLNDPTPGEAHQREEIRVLKELLSKTPNIEKQTLSTLIKEGQTTFGLFIQRSSTLEELRSGLGKKDISFCVMEASLQASPEKVRSLINSSTKPAVKEIENFSEKEVLQAKLQGYSGYSLSSKQFSDLASLQFALEYGRDYGMETVLNVEDLRFLNNIARVDCDIIQISSLVPLKELDQIPRTRFLLLMLEDQSDIEKFSSLNHRFGILLNSRNIELT